MECPTAWGYAIPIARIRRSAAAFPPNRRMTPQDFIAKWKRANLSERAGAQEHFLDLCDVLGQPTPAAEDPEGTHYTFERGVRKIGGGNGWADVWMRGHFGWEYKKKRRSLVEAYQQLLLYREDLENPPLLVVCDLDRFEIHTNFTGTIKQVHAFDLDGLANSANLEVLRKLFADPESLRPGVTTASITEQAAEKFGMLADGMRVRGVEAHAAAHFLMKLMFCMFGEKVHLLPERMFGNLLKGARGDPKRLSDRLKNLFAVMATGGDFGADPILRFNGGLFKDQEVVELQWREIDTLIEVNERDWSSVEPSIFGTLFERTLDPAKRSQIGAHYTSRSDIETLLEPVVMLPLRREWAEIRQRCDSLWAKIKAAPSQPVARKRAGRKTAAAPQSKARKDHDRALHDFVERLAHVTILDPACGSGNFLYVAIHLLLDLEKEVIALASTRGVALLPQVRPTQLSGIEINPYARELAQVVIWIGYLQWKYQNGFPSPRDPVLEPIETIREMDAILDLSDPEHPSEPEWPRADFIVGNPPFLGTKKLRGGFGDEYVERLFTLYGDRIPGFSDLCCYWFEKARDAIERRRCGRAGLLATQGIRGGLNRAVLTRISSTGGIFFAVSDRDWILDGANVHVSMVGFDDGAEQLKMLDGVRVSAISTNLSLAADITAAKKLAHNAKVGFIADVKAGKFDLPFAEAQPLLEWPNPHGAPNSDVLRPWVNGLDIVQRNRDVWIIDFGAEMSEEDAARYEKPFEIVRARVKPARDLVKRKPYRDYWWLHAEPCGEMRRRVEPLARHVATPTVSKYRLFSWLSGPTLPDHQLVVFASDDDTFFGILHSRVHEVWARSQGTQVRERESGFRYTPTTCFETFPFPEPTDAQREAIGAAAAELDRLRANWLNPPEWTREEILEFPGSAAGPWRRYVQNPDPRGIGRVCYPRLAAKDAEVAKQLAKRTLTNLYNQRPTWLDLAHRKLDETVFAAYGWPADLSDDQILERLLALNLERASD